MTRLLRGIWNTNPLWLIGTALVAQLTAMATGLLSPVLAGTLVTVMVLAYLQNTTYGLQSRSANRNSNAYHALAALAANFTFFWSLRLLVRSELPPMLLAPYVFATILGTLHANTISMKIEAFLGLSADGAKGRPQLMKLWPTVAVLVAALTGQVLIPGLRSMLWNSDPLALFVMAFAFGALVYGFLLLGSVWLRGLAVGLLGLVIGGLTASGHTSLGQGILVALLLLTVVDSFAFSLLRVARSTDHYWFHVGAVLFNLGIGFLRYMIMVNNRFDWALFLPVTTGSIIGSLMGANIAQDVGKRIKAAFDAHVTKGVKVVWPGRQLAFISLGLVLHLAVYGLAGYQAALILLAVCTWQAVSFTMVSRARQRGNPQYLAWTSVFSNGVWYICMHFFTLGAITWVKAAPYIVGNAGGSLIGQNLAMKVEQATGALMDQAPQPAKAAAKAVAV